MTITTTEERFDFGRVVGSTFSLIGRNFIPFFFLALVFRGLPSAAILYLQTNSIYGIGGVGISQFAPFDSIVLGLLALLLQGVLTRASVDALSGRGVSLGAAFSAALGLLFPLIGLGILMGLGIVAGAILLVIPGIMLLVRWLVASPALVIEQTGVAAAMGRSAELTRGHRWAIFGLVLLFGIAGWALSIGVLAATGSFAAAASGMGYSMIGIVIIPLVDALFDVVGTVGIASIYFELRRAKDGVGVEELARVFD